MRARLSGGNNGGSIVGRAVVNEHDLVIRGRNRLLETRIENAAEQMRAVVGAELNRGFHAAAGAPVSDSIAAMMRGTSRLAIHA